VLLVQKARQRARALGVPCTITAEDVVIPSHCPVLGIPLVLGNERSLAGSPSLDRLVPEWGYTPGNVVVVSHRANMLKNNGTSQELRRVAEWMETRGLS
jgi:hypothetical protein